MAVTGPMPVMVIRRFDRLFHRLEAHVFAAVRLHTDDTRVPLLAKGQTITGRIWTYLRDDRPFGGPVHGGDLDGCALPRLNCSRTSSCCLT